LTLGQIEVKKLTHQGWQEPVSEASTCVSDLARMHYCLLTLSFVKYTGGIFGTRVLPTLLRDAFCWDTS